MFFVEKSLHRVTFSSSQDVHFSFSHSQYADLHSVISMFFFFSCYYTTTFRIQGMWAHQKKKLSWSHLCKWTGENSKHYLLVANTQYECDLIKGNVILWQVHPYFRKCISLGSSIVFVVLRVMFCLEKFHFNKWQYKFWAAHGTIPPGSYNINKLPYLDRWLWFTRTIRVHLQRQLDGFL